jgi:capsular polysaccharide transport system permease protein
MANPSGQTQSSALPPAQKPALGPSRPNRRFASLRAIGALILREMATTYGRSPGGYAWALIEPVIGTAVLTSAFTFFISRPPIGTSFELFFATGMVPFLMWMAVTNKVGTSLLFSKPLLIYPAVTFFDAIVARFIVNFLTELMVFYIVMTGILVLFETRSIIDPLRLMEAIGLLAALSFGIGTANAYLFMRFSLWHQVWSIVTRPMMLISGVMMTFDAVPQFLQDILWYNPLIHIIGLVRMGFYPSYGGHYISELYVIGLSLVLTVFGFLMLEAQGRRLLNEG